MWPSERRTLQVNYRASGVIHQHFKQKVVGILSGQRLYLRDIPQDKPHVEGILATIDQMPLKEGTHSQNITVGDTTWGIVVSHASDPDAYGSHYSITDLTVTNLTTGEPVSPNWHIPWETILSVSAGV